MSMPALFKGRLSLPVIGAPLFIISVPDLVVAQCKAGVVGSFPALNARPPELLDEWLARIKEELAAYDKAKARLEVPERRRARHILITGKDDAAALAQAQQVLAQVKAAKITLDYDGIYGDPEKFIEAVYQTVDRRGGPSGPPGGGTIQ